MRRLSFIAAVFTWLIAGEAYAIHPYQLIRQVRPEVIDQKTELKVQSGALAVSYSSSVEPIPLNQIHTWTLTLKDKAGKPVSGAEVILSGDMPEHLHGMTTKPVVVATDTPGEYAVKGMNFHMPGWWEITLDISTPKSRYLARFQRVIGEEDGKAVECEHCTSKEGE